jgi:hypothetical protein
MHKMNSILAIILLVLVESFFTATALAASQPSVGSRVVSVKNQRRQSVQMTLRAAALRSIPQRPLDLALDFYDRFGRDRRFNNQDVLTIIDYRIHSSRPRLFILNLRTGQVDAELVAHGRGSDPEHDGMLNSFSNTDESKASSMGFFRISETYIGQHGYSVRMDGLNPGANERARVRAVVIHGADYVAPGLDKMGRSFGCPSVAATRSAAIIDKVKGGSIMLIYGTQFESYIQQHARKK